MTQTLPARIVVRQQFNDTDAELRKAVQAMQAAYQTMLSIEELQPLPSLSEIQESWVRSIVEEKKALISADISLTQPERKQRFDAWNFIIARSSKAISTITNILQNWTDAQWVYDEAINNYYCINFEEVVTSIATHEVPEEAHQHYKLIQEALEKVRELRQWEDATDVKSLPLADLQAVSPIVFAESWITGSMKFDRRFEYLGISPKNFKDPTNPDRIII